jgi:hypothetical protein
MRLIRDPDDDKRGKPMSASETFRSLFDEAGHYRAGEGEVPVTFATLGGSRYPGKLYFRGGLCIRAEMPYE